MPGMLHSNVKESKFLNSNKKVVVQPSFPTWHNFVCYIEIKNYCDNNGNIINFCVIIVVKDEAVSEELYGTIVNNEDLPCLENIIGRGADINYMNSSGCTNLHRAVIQGYVNIVKFLMESQVEVNAKSTLNGVTALHWAAYLNHLESLRALLAHPDVQVNDKTFGGIDDIDDIDGTGMTPLHLAISRGSTECVHALLSRPDIDKNVHINGGRGVWSGHTGVHLAVSVNQLRCLNVLLKQEDILVNSTVSDDHDHEDDIYRGMTALHISVFENKESMLSALLTHPDIQMDSTIADTGESAVFTAITRNHLDLLFMLLDHGASTLIRNHARINPLQLAISLNRGGCLKQLLDQSISIRYSQSEQPRPHLDLTPLQGSKPAQEMQLLQSLVTSGLTKDVLTHPTVTAFITLKNNKIRALQLMGLLFTITLFLIVFTYTYHYTKCLYSLPKNFTTYNSTDNELFCFLDPWFTNTWYFLAVFVTLFLIYEVIQLIVFKLAYFKMMDNYYDLAIIIMSYICCPLLIQFFPIQKFCGVITMIFGGADFMMYFGSWLSFRDLNVYIMLFKKVFTKIIYIMIPFSILFAAFCFTFHSMYNHIPDSGFDNLGYSVLKVALMSMGGLDDTTKGLQVSVLNDYNTTIVVLIFVILTMVVMLNLIVGITVDVSQEQLGESKINLRNNEIRQLYHLEKIISFFKITKFSLGPEVRAVQVTTPEEFDKKKKNSSFVETVAEQIRFCTGNYKRMITASEYLITNMCDNEWLKEDEADNIVMTASSTSLNMSEENVEYIEHMIRRETKKNHQAQTKEGQKDPADIHNEDAVTKHMKQIEQNVKNCEEKMDDLNNKLSEVMDILRKKSA